MVALLVGLKLRLLRNALRADGWQVVGTVLAALVGLGLAVAGVAGVVGLRFVDAGNAQQALVVGGSLLVLGWSLVPLLAFGVDETLDPSRFALLPLTGRRLVPGLAAAALVGVPGAATAVVVLTTVVAWARDAASLLVAVPAALVGLGTCVVGSRLLTTLGARALSTRRARETGATVGVLLVSSLGIIPVLVSTQLRRVGSLGNAVDVLAWTPLGWVWAAPGDAATGHLGRGLLRLGLAALLLVAAGGAWGALLDRALTSQTASGGSRRRRGTADARQAGTAGRRHLVDRLPATPAGAVAGRSLRYWRRDARYVTLFSSVVIASVVPVVAIRAAASASGATQSGTADAAVIVAGVGPFVGMLIGLSASNDLGYDGTAFAAHLITGAPGRADRAGRIAALLAWAVPVVTVVSAVGCLVAGVGRLVPALIGVGYGMLLGSVSAATVGGALAPYPMPEPGANPFRGNSGGTARALLAQAACGAVACGVASPAATALVAALLGWSPGVWLALVLGPLVGVPVLVVAIRAGGQIVDERGPEILAAVRRAQ